MKKVLSLILALCLIVSIPVYTHADEVTSGTVSARDGDFKWEFNDGTLYLTGSGYCIDDCPWEHLKDQIENIVFDGSLTIVGKAFTEMPNLTSVVLPDDLVQIGYAFEKCTYLEEVKIPDTVTSIENSFNECTHLRSVTLPADLENVDRSFQFAVCLTQIKLPSKLKTISASFVQTGLVNLTVPKNITSIINGSFQSSTYMKEVCFLGNAPELNGSSFMNVNATVYYPKGNSSWSDSVRSNWPETLQWEAVSDPASVKMSYTPYWTLSKGVLIISGSGEIAEETPWIDANSVIRKIIIEEGVTNIPEDAFYGTTSLEEVSLPDSLKRIGNQAFECSVITTLEIPAQVTEIGAYAFSDCDRLTQINIPDGVTEINEHLFSRCRDLAEIVLPQNLTRIGNSAFSGCSSLTTITIPANVQSIENYAFEGCGGITEVHFDGDAPAIEEYAFNGLYATAYYHADKAGWTEDVLQDYGGNLTWEPYHTHSYTSVVTAPTCTEQGYTTSTCDICGKVIIDDYVDALGHDFGEPEFVSKDSGHIYICTVCGAEMSENCTFELVNTQDATLLEHGVKEYACSICGGTWQEVFHYRVYGNGRCETAIATAEAMKDVLAVDCFDAIIIASGDNFADALAGSYLAAQKNAPILLYRASAVAMNLEYIQENLSEDGIVYLLGGTAAVPADVETGLIDAGIEVKRLAGNTRFDTNLEILLEAGIVAGQEILVATGYNFADSLSASATGLPILMVNNGTGVLTDTQIEFLMSLEDCTFTIIGGTAAVSEALENEVREYGEVNRLAGDNREATSVLVAETYFDSPERIVLAYSRNFPDGLCGGPLAYVLGAPLILTNAGQEAAAADYVTANGISKCVVLGGTAVLADDTVNAVFDTNE